MTGRRRRPASAPKRLVAELAAGLITPLRERLMTTMDAVVADGPYELTSELHAALGPAISARYREWRARDLDGLLGDLLAPRTRVARSTRHPPVRGCAGCRPRWASAPTPTTTRSSRP